MAESENQFSLTRAAYNVEDAKKQILINFSVSSNFSLALYSYHYTNYGQNGTRAK